MKNILEAPFMIEMKRITENMYRLGWDERNAGNISYLLTEKEAEAYLDLNVCVRTFPLSIDAKALAGKTFIVTGTGKYFKNVQHEPEENLGIVRISDDGKSTRLLWGFSGGGSPTSEFSVHLMCHSARLKANPANRIIMHAHPTNLLAMTFVHSIDEKEFTRTLWQLCIEGIVVFPEGIAVLPWMLCGTNEIAEATAKKMDEHRLVMWAQHGVFGAGNTFDEAFGLIETAEKAAETHIKTMHVPRINIPTDAQIAALAEKWNVNYRKDWLS
ncbi:MAG: rhamnulose-1-phosphate aldolase [Treponema sp.]|jgi:rhamnulose-1-phosphate aldolase|nr:rhamnulose-1-phosphate aldolase [Treponema sp.]